MFQRYTAFPVDAHFHTELILYGARLGDLSTAGVSAL